MCGLVRHVLEPLENQYIYHYITQPLIYAPFLQEEWLARG